jgi:GNAT superfamily N-acetyltransferase
MQEPPPNLIDNGPLDVDMKPAWRKADPGIEADAKALWRRLSVLPEGVDMDLRAEEIVVAAYVGEELAGVSTAFIRPIEFLRHRFAMLRGMVAPEFRMHNIGRRLVFHSRLVLEEWAREHPEEGVMGVAGVLQNRGLVEKPRLPTSPVGAFTLVGYTDAGEQIRVAWFDHVRV